MTSLSRVVTAVLALGAAAAWAQAASTPPQHPGPASRDGNLVVGLCDGTTTREVPGVREGQPMERAQAERVAGQLMAAWRQRHPDARWDAPGAPVLLAQAPQQQPSPGPRSPPKEPGVPPTAPGKATGTQGPTSQSGASEAARKAGADVQSGHTYGAFSARDEALWKASTEAVVKRGKDLFHDSKRLGGTTGISCDMCHPDASNTHPETYPKYQVQLGRVALLRDMINWCIQNPVRGKPIADDSEEMRALEAYIYAQRKGAALDYGKH